MNPNTYEQSGLRLPEPVDYDSTVGTEQGPKANGPEALPELHAQMVPLAPLASAPPLSVPPTLGQTQVQTVQGSTSSAGAATLTASDADLIEKEWVDKAKQIVEQSKEDPHMQSSQMSRFKAEYMKKRYNKDIKIENN